MMFAYSDILLQKPSMMLIISTMLFKVQSQAIDSTEVPHSGILLVHNLIQNSAHPRILINRPSPFIPNNLCLRRTPQHLLRHRQQSLCSRLLALQLFLRLSSIDPPGRLSRRVMPRRPNLLLERKERTEPVGVVSDPVVGLRSQESLLFDGWVHELMCSGIGGGLTDGGSSKFVYAALGTMRGLGTPVGDRAGECFGVFEVDG
jgi:hypothetical protein